MTATPERPVPSAEVLDLARRYGELCRQGRPPDLAALFGPLERWTPIALATALCIDMRERWQQHERALAEHYLEAFPRLWDDREAALDVVYCEYLVRDERGESPSIAEFESRFPSLAAELARQIAMHEALHEANDPPTMGAGRNGTRDGARDDTGAPATAGVWPSISGAEVLGRLGQGGMGVVYKAWQQELRRAVAVKMLRPGVDDSSQALARFRVEGEAVARLRHPNIIQIHEVGELEGRPYIVMEFADGGSLAEQLKKGPWPGRDAANLALTLANAVHFAHQQGVLHRDLTPANVLLAGGIPKISDFGLAKLLSDGGTLTGSGSFLGTPGYMAPEQAIGASRDAGPAIDVYGLGAILYELITGRPPFKAATLIDTLSQVVNAEPMAPRQLQPRMPLDLETICLKALRKEPARRYASALDFAADLRRFLDGRPIEARPVRSFERAWRWGKRNPGWAVMLGTTTALLVLIAVGASVMSLSLGRALGQAQEQSKRARTAERAANDALRQSYLDQARALRLTRTRGQRFQSLAAIKKALDLSPPTWPRDDARNAAIACLVLPDIELDKEWELPSRFCAAALDPTFKRYVRSGPEQASSIRGTADDIEIASLPALGQTAWPGLLFSPDGRLIQQLFKDGRLRLWRMEGRVPTLVLDERAGTPNFETTPSFRFDSRELAIGNAAERSVRFYDTTTGKELRRLAVGFAPSLVAFRPGHDHVAVAGGAIVRVVDMAGHDVLPTALPHPDNLFSINWHPHGDILATGCDDMQVRLWDVVAGTLALPPLQGHRARGLLVQFNHAGDRLASTDWNYSMRLWDTRTGGQLLQMPASSVTFSADDRSLALDLAGGRCAILRVSLGREMWTAVARNESHGERLFLSALFSADGRFLVVNASEDLVFIDASEGVELARIPLAHAHAVAFEPGPAAMLTWSNGLLLRWPIHAEPATGTTHVGPAQFIDQLQKRPWGRAAVSGDGGIVVLPDADHGAVLLKRPGRRLALAPREDVRNCAVSPDGHWVATGNHWNTKGVGVTVWNAETGAAVKDLTDGSFCKTAFSPDGRWLLTTGGKYQLWEVGTWNERWSRAQPASRATVAFSPGSQMVAMTGAVSQVILLDPGTGAEIARLTAPEQAHVYPQCFSPDASQFVAIVPDEGTIHLWDLRAIRAQLREMKLDWNLPDYPPPSPATGRRLRVHVEPGRVPS